jgi:hypothetical protein
MYSEAGQMLRHYLSWREKLLGGYVAVIAAFAVAFVKAPADYKHLGPTLSALAMFLTVVFWLLERRNRELFNRCIDAGVAIEGRAHARGAFGELSKKPTTLTHSRVLDCLFATATVSLLFLALGLWWRHR